MVYVTITNNYKEQRMRIFYWNQFLRLLFVSYVMK